MSVFVQEYTIPFWAFVIIGIILGILIEAVTELYGNNKILKLEREDIEASYKKTQDELNELHNRFRLRKDLLNQASSNYAILQIQHEKLKKEFEETSKQLEYYKNIHEKIDKLGKQFDDFVKNKEI